MARIRHERIGDVFVREFDQGIIETLGGVVMGRRYYLPLNLVPGVVPPNFSDLTGDSSEIGQQMPGIPITMNESSEVCRYLIPGVRVTREDPNPALERRYAGALKYRAPADGESPVIAQMGLTDIEGYARYEEQEEGIPTDLWYTISVEAGGKRAKTNATILLKHCMSKYWPNGVVNVVDSLGRERKYNVHTEGPSGLSSVSDIRDRTIIYALSCRVIGELDVRPAVIKPAVTEAPVLDFHQMSELPED